MKNSSDWWKIICDLRDQRATLIKSRVAGPRAQVEKARQIGIVNADLAEAMREWKATFP